MKVSCFRRLACISLVGLTIGQTTLLAAEQVSVRYPEGLLHGYLTLQSMDEGKILAEGELQQTAHGERVTSQLTFHFKDGSLNDETAIFSQRGKFHLLSDHLVQKGPAFKHPLEMNINATSGQVIVHYTDDDGKEKTESAKMKIPPDVANGFTLVLLKNIKPGTASTTVSMVVATPKPRLVNLVITPYGEDSFTTAGTSHKAMHYSIKVDIGGLAGWIAPLIGKEPPNIHVWVSQGKAPAFVKSEGPLYNGGPNWRIELTSPVWATEKTKRN